MRTLSLCTPRPSQPEAYDRRIMVITRESLFGGETAAVTFQGNLYMCNGRREKYRFYYQV